jgi:tetratricopeptide (TPR) repeat protein
MGSRRRLRAAIGLLLALLPAIAPLPSPAASCDVADRAPLLLRDQRPCLPVTDEGVFLRSTGVPWVAHFAHGAACLAEGHYAFAAAEFEQARREAPNEVRPPIFEAVAYDRLGDHRRVAALVSQARDTARRGRPPMSTETVAGATKLLNGKYAEAFAMWQYFPTWTYNDATYGDAHAIEPFRTGLGLAGAGKYCDALRVLVPVIADAPTFGDIRFVVGALYYALGKHAQARFEWEAAAINHPAEPESWSVYPPQWTALNLLVEMPRR